MHISLIGTCRRVPGERGTRIWTDGRAAPGNDEGRARGPALVRQDAELRDYQVLLLQPFVPPVQARVYVPGEVLDFVIVNTPVEFEVDESV